MTKYYRSVLTLLLAVSFVAASFYFMLDIATPRPTPIDLQEEEAETVYFGVISRYGPKQILRGYQPLMDYLSRTTPYHFELRLSRNYMETVDQLASGKISFASLGNYTYVHANRDFDVQCIAMPLHANGLTENYNAFIVQDNSALQSLEDLKGKSLAMASRYSFSAWMAIWILSESGISTSDLAAYTHLDHHNEVAEKVIRGEYDAGVVKAVVAEAYRNKGLRVLHTSPPIPSVPLVVGPNVSEEMVQSVRSALLSLRDEIDQGVIDTQGWDEEIKYGFGPGSDASYDYTRTILQDLGVWK